MKKGKKRIQINIRVNQKNEKRLKSILKEKGEIKRLQKTNIKQVQE